MNTTKVYLVVSYYNDLSIKYFCELEEARNYINLRIIRSPDAIIEIHSVDIYSCVWDRCNDFERLRILFRHYLDDDTQGIECRDRVFIDSLFDPFLEDHSELFNFNTEDEVQK